jgi:hypothetical protein
MKFQQSAEQIGEMECMGVEVVAARGNLLLEKR